MDHMDSEGDSMGFVKAGGGAWDAQDLSLPLMEVFTTDVRLFWEGIQRRRNCATKLIQCSKYSIASGCLSEPRPGFCRRRDLSCAMALVDMRVGETHVVVEGFAVISTVFGMFCVKSVAEVPRVDVF